VAVAQPPQAARTLYGQLQTFQLALLVILRRLWPRVAPGDLDGSWARIAPQLVAYTAGAQLAAAQAATGYVPAVLEETGIPDRPEARVRPEAFAGTAYDGRPLDTLLEGGVRHAKAKIGDGTDPAEATIGGREWLETTLRTVVADAARDATAANMAVRGNVSAWVRVVNPPCCSRCAVLGGRVYKWNQPMPRHPGCDCFILPNTVAGAEAYTVNARDLADRGLITDLTQAQRKRLDGGASMSKVLNESRDRWRQRMAVERREARYARYSSAERRAADRRAARRATNGLVVPEGWGNAPTPLPPGGIQDFLSHLTSRVEALRELEARGITD
jgi:hypothetical protein